MRSNANRAVAAVTAAAIALTTAGVAPAFAASKKAPEAQADGYQLGSPLLRSPPRATRNNAAGAAAFAAIVGGIATYAAAREYRKSRERSYYNGYNGYYGQPHGYYGGGRRLLRQLVRPEVRPDARERPAPQRRRVFAVSHSLTSC